MPLLSTIGGASAFGLRKRTAAVTFIDATGGSITTSGDYKYHAFTSSGTFSVTAAPVAKTIDCLIVAGGGGGGVDKGGGGGGVVIKLAQTVSIGSYTVTVGAGGAIGVTGDNSVFRGFTALGGGAPNANGGSGGGFAEGEGSTSGLQPTSGSGGFGNRGDSDGVDGGGGGGAGSAASAGTGGTGYSGSPLSSSLFGAGGGGENGGVTAAGGANTGDGASLEAAGGSGIVIIRYLFQ